MSGSDGRKIVSKWTFNVPECRNFLCWRPRSKTSQDAARSMCKFNKKMPLTIMASYIKASSQASYSIKALELLLIMEELHQGALAYYNNGSQNLQLLASNFFRTMDRNGDGRVSKSEFVTFLRDNGYGWVNPSLFNDLDQNRDGGLDFREVLTFYYLIKTRNLWCNNCSVCLKGLYFTCVECFDRAANTYDLCCNCYSGRRFRHPHTCFLDNHMLLRSKRMQLRQAGLPNLNLVITPAPQVFYPQATPVRNRLQQTFQALEGAITVANVITQCTIM